MTDHITLNLRAAPPCPRPVSYRQETITSRSNAWLKQLRQVAARGTTTADGFALAESPHLLQEAIRSEVRIQRVFASERVQESVGAAMPPHRQVPLHPVADRLFQDLATTTRNQGVLALVQLRNWDAATVLSGLTVVLDGVQDPGNAGTIARTAEAFGASGIVFLKGSAAPTNPKALRASAGSLFRVPFLHKLGAAEFLALAQQHGKTVLAATTGQGLALAEADLSANAAIVIGSETHGVSPLLLAAATPVAIPTQSVESLNAAIAAAIVLYESARRAQLP